MTRAYKTQKKGESVDWESVRTKYEDICGLLKEKFPDRGCVGAGVNHGDALDLHHYKDELTVKILTTKLKAIRLKNRQAVDSGHGRVVKLYFELCQEIWGGSPAMEQIPGGLESTEDSGTAGSTDSMSDSLTSSTTVERSLTPSSADQIDAADNGDNGPAPSAGSQPMSLTEDVVSRRRSVLESQLRTHKQDCLMEKVPVDQQFLTMA